MMPAHQIHTSPQIILPDDWFVLQSAHDAASKTLDRSPKTHPCAERLAKQVFRLFDLGHRDPVIIAAIAAETERARAGQADDRSKALKLVPWANEPA
ncbi:hypothetical protein GF108_12555 [Phyllobacterium sp. SYP-B3895]|uniref:hypothetical protein n=1 Tax=Phyllobacterium sp. SYP-B3895 TaxID=2663240 RepID=UPI001299AFF8|nr:hypothetical protein [Phyllobacterium sp. SYP-B3895]MRG56408.1 hypothetical protein [Phyllobacterium sp. SYP-B3895]